jgi:hypothetical protein
MTVSLQPFQQTPASGAIGASGDVAQSGAVGSSGAVGTPQIQALQDQQSLAAITAAQEQQDQQDQKAQHDSSKGWSLTNPFQDIGQIWHDVETHTVAYGLHAANWLFTNLIKRPYTTIALYSGHNDYELQHDPAHANSSWFQGSLWAQAWDESAHISPGRATVLAANDSAIPGVPEHVTWGDVSGHQFVDPMDAQQRDAYLNDKSNPLHNGMQIASGGEDAAIDWYADPANHITKAAEVARIMKNAPILETDTVAQKVDKIASDPGQQFDQDVANGRYDFASLAEHPMVKGSMAQPNPLRYTTAALLDAAKTPGESRMIRQILAGIPQVSSSTLDMLAKQNEDLATQISNAMAPLEVEQNYALTSAAEGDRDEWLQKVAQAKIKAAQAQIDANDETMDRLRKIFGQQQSVTKTSAITNKLAEMKGAGKYANTRDVPIIHIIQNARYNYPIRIYQSLTDRVPGLINHNDDSAVEYARSWLNKSSTLTPEQKIDYTQRYANATVAQRQQIWTSIENDVYKNVGDRFGISQGQMNKILTTTRKKGQTVYMAARSKAYGALNIPGMDAQGVLPTADEQIIAHPQLITQLESGAMPLANLKQLENALERMQDTGLLAPLRNAYAVSKDTLGYILDNVYGMWKPATLMTGHRAFNHIGDDFLRGVAKVGALASLRNLQEGLPNFLRNNANRLTKNMVVNNVMSKHEQAIGEAKADYEGTLNLLRTQKALGLKNVPPEVRVKSSDILAKKRYYSALRKIKFDFIPDTHRLGTGQFRITGSSELWDEAFGGPNGDYYRWVSSSHPSFMSTVDGANKMTHAMQMAIRGPGFATISAVDDPVKHTPAYVHYVRNQLMPDPAAKQIVAGTPLDDVAKWITGTSQGRQYQKALGFGDPDIKVNELASMVKQYLPYDGMRDAALAGKFTPGVIEKYMPDAAMRPDINANIAALVHGGDGPTNILRKASDWMMEMTGTMPDDILVRHPLYNTLYKSRLTDSVQSWMRDTGESVIGKADRDMLIAGAHTGARSDLKNLVYDVSRFNDMGHTLRFISPFFNAWFNAMTTWSKLLVENPGLLARGYQAKRMLWNSPFAINNQTGEQADVNTPWDQTSFVLHMPKPLAEAIGSETVKDIGKNIPFMAGMGRIPIDAKTLVSPTYIDAIGNPGFGPLVSIPVNQIVKDHPTLMNDAIVRSMLNNIVDQNSMQQLLPSGVNDVVGLSQLLTGAPDASSQYAKNVWSIYQEQYYDYLNGQRSAPPNWGSVETQAKYLTVMDLFVNRLSPLGFKPAASHSFLTDQYRQMQQADPKNARQDFYQKYGRAGMYFTQSLATDPTGIPATVGASAAVKRYANELKQFPELAAAIVGPEGNGNFDQMAYDWQVAQGLRQKLSPEDAAKQVNINTGWAQYGQLSSQVQSLLQVRGLTSINAPQARDLKALLNNFVAATGDPQDQRHNPDFYVNYGAYNQNDYMNRIQALFHIAQDPALLANPLRSDIRSLHAYVQVRDATYAALQKRPAKNLTASGNQDLADQYDSWVANRMQTDTKFAQLYDRFLRKDDWKEPMH